VIAEQSWDITAGQHFLRLVSFLPDVDTAVKLEGLNPAGSIKMKTARELVLDAEQRGLITPDTELIESTSGNLGIALATICAERGYRLSVVTDPNATMHAIRHMRALGANVVVVRERDDHGGYLKVRIDFIHRRLAEDPNLLWLNQYANGANVMAHRKHTVAEILEGFGVPDWLFVGAGTTGTLMGCVEGLRMAGASTQVVAVDSVGSVTFGTPAPTRRIPGLGTSRRPEIFTDDNSFVKVLVPEADTIRMCRRIAQDHGLLLGGSSGTVLAGVMGMRERIAPGSTVLAISADQGDRYLDTVYDDAWVVHHFGTDALTPHARPPNAAILDQLAVGRG
jgi:N-(2-amino-2-carboxyethyl)-L-glutamate synthase